MIPTELLEEFKATTYLVYNKDIPININRHNKRLEELLQDNKAESWAFITAWNPYSKVLTDEENNIRHQQLMAMTKKYVCFEGEGRGKDPKWKPERSLLIIGIAKDDAAMIGNHFQQHAIVIGGYQKPAELLFLNTKN